MDFNWNSGNLWLGLGLGCVIAAVVAAAWSLWLALVLVLAGFGFGAGVPLCMGRSWPNLLESWGDRLESTVLALSRFLRSAFPQILEKVKKDEEQSERPTLRERAAGRAPVERPPGPAREQSPQAIEPRPCSFHTWPLQTCIREPAGESVVRPQNVFRMAAGEVTAESEREKPIQRDEPEEVIDLPSVLENLEKRYRAKRPDAGSAVPEMHPPKEEEPVTIDIEEIRRRLMAAYGRRLSREGRQESSAAPRENLHGATFRRDKFNDTPAITRVLQAEPPRVPKAPAGETARGAWPVRDSDSGRQGPADGVCRGPQKRFGGRIVECVELPEVPRPARSAVAPASGTILPGDSGVPAGISEGASSGAFHGDRPAGNEPGAAGAPFTPVQPWQYVVNPQEPARPAAPSEIYGRERPTWVSTSPAPPAPAFAAPDPATPAPDSAGAPPVPLNPANPGGAEFSHYTWLPPLSLLYPADSAVAPMSQDDLIDGGIMIEEKLAEFRVKVNVLDAYAGPVITRYEVQPAVGVRGGQVVSLMKDLARTLGVAAIRVVETIPGKTCMGLELPNPTRQIIRLSEVLSSEVFQSHDSKLAVVLGKDIIGEPVVADLAKAPHLLVAGTTGSGKSVGVNAMILSLLYRATPEEVRFVMIDPKMLELSIYDGIPHLLAPVVTDMKLAANALNWCVGEMERRYRLMSGLGVRNLDGYNLKVREAIDIGKPLLDPFSPMLDEPVLLAPLPYIVVVVDELSDLMMVSGKKIEELIARLAQKARAAGIHLILATQRPSVDVITGLIKANIPTRIAFQVSSKIDSRTILDQMGAECLLGQGDMLYLPPGTGYPLRVHGAFVADEEVHAVAEYLKGLGEPDYVEGVLGGTADSDDGSPEVDRLAEDADPLYDEAVAFVLSSRRASISAVQRQLRIGYNRAARLVEQMEAAGLVSPMESNGNRTVLVPERSE